MAKSSRMQSMCLGIFPLVLLAVAQLAARPPQAPVPAGPPSPSQAASAGAATSQKIENAPARAAASTTGPPPGSTSPNASKIETDASSKDLLPAAPRFVAFSGPVLSDDLAQVPEIALQEKIDLQRDPAKWEGKEPRFEAARLFENINLLNTRRPDGFLLALMENRPDLAGLPFALGDRGRTVGSVIPLFNKAARTVDQVLGTVAGTAPEGRGLTVSDGAAGLDRPGSDRPGVPPTPSASPAGPAPATAPAVPPGAPMPPIQAALPDTTSGFPSMGSQVAAISKIFEGFAMFITPSRPINSDEFWRQYRAACDTEDEQRERTDKQQQEGITLARMAALIQILGAQTPELRLGLVKYLSGTPHVEATKALARMAIYSREDSVRHAAIDALQVRREKDSTEILLAGLRYPWPPVAKRSAEAIAKLGRTDLIGDLIALLDAPDPRLVEAKEKGSGKVLARELIKVNRNRNCLLCHPPAGLGPQNSNALLAEVPVEDRPLPRPGEAYKVVFHGQLVRSDKAYLRPDFSISLPVKDSSAWREMQPFDFVVRARELSSEEAAKYREQLKPRVPETLNPYRLAVLSALKALTGKDAEPTADAWRKRLQLPGKKE